MLVTLVQDQSKQLPSEFLDPYLVLLDHFEIALPLGSLGSLDGPLIKHSTSIYQVVLFKLLSQIALDSAFRFLHSLYFIYQDLKAANVLLAACGLLVWTTSSIAN